MQILITVAYNLKGAESDDYEEIKEMLEEAGISQIVTDKKRNVSMKLPSTTFMGIVEGTSNVEIKDALVKKFKAILTKQHIRGTILVSACGTCSLSILSDKSV